MGIEIEWLKAADLDLDSIKYIEKVEHLTPVAMFHCQQAVEKSLKAVFEFKRLNIPKIHKLQTLTLLLKPDIELDIKKLQILDELYIDSRYPGDLGLMPSGKPSLNDVREFYSFAKEVYLKVSVLINQEKNISEN